MKKTKKPARKPRLTRSTAPVSKWRRVLRRSRYVPAIALTIFATGLSWQPHLHRLQWNADNDGVLAYATNVSQAGLLSATNVQRANNGVAALSANGLLNAAAQAKANDMVNRNYWSHQTPDGQQPWVFIVNAGYQYLAAGENLAYGYMTSAAAVTGWMNSPGHKANLLSTNYTEVGFGIANSPDFIGHGQQTVVVAMYAKPQVASAAAPPPASPPPAAAPSAVQPAANKPTPSAPSPQPTAAPEEPAAEPTPEPEPEPAQKEEEIIAVSLTEDDDTIAAAPLTTRRVQLFGIDNTFFSAAAVILAVCSVGLLWALHKGFHIRKRLASGERFIARHLHIDLTVLAIVYLGFVLLSASGAVR